MCAKYKLDTSISRRTIKMVMLLQYRDIAISIFIVHECAIYSNGITYK